MFDGFKSINSTKSPNFDTDTLHPAASSAPPEGIGRLNRASYGVKDFSHENTACVDLVNNSDAVLSLDGRMTRSCPCRWCVLVVERSAFLFPYVGRILKQANAPIPAKDSVVVSRWTNLFGLRERMQSLFEEG